MSFRRDSRSPLVKLSVKLASANILLKQGQHASAVKILESTRNLVFTAEAEVQAIAMITAFNGGLS